MVSEHLKTKKEILEHIEYLKESAKHDIPLAKDAPLNNYDSGWSTALDYVEDFIKTL